MIRVMFLFLLLAVICYVGILAAEKVTGKRVLQLTLNPGSVIISSTLATVLTEF